MLMIAGVYLNDKQKEYADVWNKAHEAMNLFVNNDQKEARAEANFLLGMISIKKSNRGIKSDSLKLRKQPKSELSFGSSFEPTPKITRATSNIKQRLSEDEDNYLKLARQQFIELKHDYGSARVSLALAIRKTLECKMTMNQQNLNNETAGTSSINLRQMDEIQRYLQSAIIGFEKFRDYQNLIS